MAGPHANRVCQSYGSAPSRPRERACVSHAADDPPESAPPAGCTRKSLPDPGTDRASSPSRRITPGKVNHRPFALASFFSKLLERFQLTESAGRVLLAREQKFGLHLKEAGFDPARATKSPHQA